MGYAMLSQSPLSSMNLMFHGVNFAQKTSARYLSISLSILNMYTLWGSGASMTQPSAAPLSILPFSVLLGLADPQNGGGGEFQPPLLFHCSG